MPACGSWKQGIEGHVASSRAPDISLQNNRGKNKKKIHRPPSGCATIILRDKQDQMVRDVTLACSAPNAMAPVIYMPSSHRSDGALGASTFMCHL